jgi:hypothetical protein
MSKPYGTRTPRLGWKVGQLIQTRNWQKSLSEANTRVETRRLRAKVMGKTDTGEVK